MSSLTRIWTPIEGEVVLRIGMENSLTSLSSGFAVSTRRPPLQQQGARRLLVTHILFEETRLLLPVGKVRFEVKARRSRDASEENDS